MAVDSKQILTMAIVALVVVLGVSYFMKPAATGTGTTGSGPTATGGDQCYVIPTYTFSAVDNYGTTSVTGTNEIKDNGNVPVTSLQYPTKGHALTFWQSNYSYFCAPVSTTADCGSNQLQAKCFANSSASVSIKLIDTDASPNAEWTAASHNISLGANAVAHVQMKYLGVSKQSALPFGGCVAIEYPATLASVTMSGALSSATPCPYKWTYSVSAVANTYALYAVPANFDAETVATYKFTDMVFQSGATDPSGNVKVVFQPANYYITNDGNFVLGIEKDQNQDSTKTAAAISAAATLTLT